MKVRSIVDGFRALGLGRDEAESRQSRMREPEAKTAVRSQARTRKWLFVPSGVVVTILGWILWDIATGPTKTLREPNYRTITVAFCPILGMLASANQVDGIIRLWDIDNGRPVFWLPNTQAVRVLAASPDGKRLAFGSGFEGLTIWNLELGKRERRIDAFWIFDSVAFSKDRTAIVVAGDTDPPKYDQGAAKVFDVETGSLRCITAAHSRSVLAACFSPDGARVATGDFEGTIKLSDAMTGDELQVLTSPSRKFVTSLVFSRYGRILASAVGREIILWNVEDGAIIRTLRGHKRGVACLAFSPDGEALASCSPDGTVQLWDVKTGARLKRFRHAEVRSLSFSLDGTYLATGGDGIKLWDVTNIW